MEDAAQFSITRISDDEYKIIVQDDKEILRSDIIRATDAMLHIIKELKKLRKISEFER